MKASVYIATSLDGFIARKNGELDWLPGSDSVLAETPDNDFGFQAFMQSVDVIVMGRNTYEFVLSQGEWPYGNMRVVVLSRQLTKLSDKVPQSVALRACSPKALYSELLRSGAKHLYIDGGNTIQNFLAVDLIDELIITRVPILIGNGITLFGPLERDIKLQHLNTKTFSNEFVQSKYQVIYEKGGR